MSFPELVGARVRPLAARAVLALALVGFVTTPLSKVDAPDASEVSLPTPRAAAAARVLAAGSPATADVLSPNAPVPQHFEDGQAAVAFDPPAGWLRTPDSALNPVSDPAEPVFELARYQLRIGDPKLYETAVPITSGLVDDALAVISIGVAREGSDLVGMDIRVRGEQNVGSTQGFVTLDEDSTYEGVRTFTRYFISREDERIVVFSAAVADADWPAQQSAILASAASVRADPRGANAPAAPPPPPPPAPAVIAPAPDPTAQIRSDILSRAAMLLGLQYVWGGNSTTRGMDCSAYVSWTWDVSRFTTDSIWQVSFPIGKGELRPGDALNLTTGRDPQRFGHIRLFEAWANVEHTLLWVYEETPPRAVHRVIAYDERYQPIRLGGLSATGETPVIPGLPAPERSFQPAPPRPARATPAPTRRQFTFTPTARPTQRTAATVRPTPRPSSTVRPSPTASPRPTVGPGGTLPPIRLGPPGPTRTPTPREP